MKENELRDLVDYLVALPNEKEWVCHNVADVAVPAYFKAKPVIMMNHL